MMRLHDHFYCVGCEKKLPNMEADIIFRTGYFEVVHPMGYCLICSLEQDKQEIRDRALVEPKAGSYDYRMYLREDAKVAEKLDYPYINSNRP